MKLTINLILWELGFSLLKYVNAADALIVYCQDPVSETRTVSFCGGTTVWSMFPGKAAYGYLRLGATLTTSTWTSNYVSTLQSLEIVSSSVHAANFFHGTCTSASIGLCAPTLLLFTGTVTHFVVYAPANGEVTSQAPVTVTETTTATLLSTVTTTETEAVDTVTVTDDTTCPLVLTTTQFVSFSIGTTGGLTIFTSGPTPGTSTYTVCESD